MIVVFGSINVDLTFRVARQPLPGETVLCPSYLASPGGKGANQAVAAARAGAPTAMIGCVGRDGFSETALDTMRGSGVDISHVATVDTPTGCAAISVDAAAENAIVVASGANRTVRATQTPDELLGPETILLMQMEVPLEQNWTLIKRARRRNAQIALNVAPAAAVPTSALDALDYLFVNEIEGRTIAASSGLGSASATDLPRLLAERHDLTCVLTLGAAGAVLHGPDGGCEVPALAVEALDTTGAGDTFVGAMAAGLHAGLSAHEAARRGSVAAAIACTREGAQTGIPYSGEIEDSLPRLRGQRTAVSRDSS